MAVTFFKGQWGNPCGIEARIFWENLTILWLQMPWLLPLLSHQHSWYCVCMINKSLSSLRKNFSYLCHLSAELWQQIQIWFYVPQIDSVALGLSPGLREWPWGIPIAWYIDHAYGGLFTEVCYSNSYKSYEALSTLRPEQNGHHLTETFSDANPRMKMFEFQQQIN